MIGGALGNAAKLSVAGEARLVHMAKVENVQALLRRQLEGALPLPSTRSPDEEALAFNGNPTAVALATRRPASLLQGGVYLAQFTFEPPSKPKSGGTFLAHWQLIDPSRPEAGQTGRVETVRLVEDVAAVDIRYFGRKASGAAGWHEDWQSEARLPSLISISLHPTESAGWRWPPLILAPRIATLAVDLHPNIEITSS